MAYSQDLEEDAEAHFQRGREKFDADGYETAILDFTRALQAEPGHPEALELRGASYVMVGRAEEAVIDLERVVETDNTNAFAYYYLGCSWWSLGKNVDALKALQRSAELEEDSATYDMLATIELEVGLLRDALEHVDEAIRLAPEEADYYFTRGTILRQLGRPEAAKVAFESANAIDSSYSADGELTDAELETTEAFRILFATYWVWALLLLLVFTVLGLLSSRPARAGVQAIPENHEVPRYDGNAKDLFRLYLQNVVLTVITLGVYRFWAKVRMRRYRYQHTLFADGRFDYHATGKEKLLGFLKGVLVLSPVIAAFYFAQPAIADKVGQESAPVVSVWGFMLVIFLLRPLMLVGALRFNLSRTSWNNLRFRFTGTVARSYRLYLRDLLLLVITLGLYTIHHRRNVQEFRLKNTRMGDERFGFAGTGDELFKITLLGTIGCWITLGLYIPWHVARLQRFHIDGTRFRGVSFHSRLTGGQVLHYCALPMFTAVLTLGLALPWAINRWYRLLADTTSYAEAFDPESVQSIHDNRAGALLEGVENAGEALSGLGDMFGA